MKTFLRNFRGAWLSLAGLLLLAAGVPSPARGCSICRCGDPTFNALGTDVYKDGAFRVFLDWERFDKEQGTFLEGGEGDGVSLAKHEGHDHAAVREAVVENRLTTSLSYSFGERAIAVARLPWSSRTISGEGPSERTQDLSDPELYTLVRLWSSNFAADVGRRAWISALAGVKTAWGKNDLAGGGERLDEHLQPGTGSTDWFGGLSGFYLIDRRSSLFGSVQRRLTGANDFGYEYGEVTLANLGYERKLRGALDAAVELNFRQAGRDRVDAAGTLDPNTGGSLTYLTPRLVVDLRRGLVGRLAVQIPVRRNLNGDQRERAVANLGFTYLF